MSEHIRDGRFGQKKLLFFLFLIVVVAIGFFTIYGDFGLTGNAVKSGNFSNDSINIKGEFTSAPNLNFNSEFDEILIVGGGEESFIDVGNLELNLFGSSQIILKGFDGRLQFNGEKISELKGSAKEVLINGEVLSTKEGSTKINLAKDFSYSILEIKDDLFLKKLDYFTSGVLTLNGNKVFKLENEEIGINGFYGKIYLEEGDFDVKGVVDKLEIKGDSKVSIS